jgi:hypothetical protein
MKSVLFGGLKPAIQDGRLRLNTGPTTPSIKLSLQRLFMGGISHVSKETNTMLLIVTSRQ